MGEWTAELRKIAAVDKLGIQGRGRGWITIEPRPHFIKSGKTSRAHLSHFIISLWADQRLF
jgi:hypothetical protein